MKRPLYLLLCCLPLVYLGAQSDDKKDEKKEADKSAAEKKEQGDQEKIQGKWKIESSKRDGEDSQGRVGDTDIFDGDKLTIESKGISQPIEAKFKLDSAKKPAEIDVVIKVKDGGLAWSGIYKLEGDTLTICWAQNSRDEKRPSDFNCKKGDGRVLFVYKKVKEDTSSEKSKS